MGIGDGSRKWAEVRQLVGEKDILHMEATEPKVSMGDSRGSEYIHFAKVEDSHREVGN